VIDRRCCHDGNDPVGKAFYNEGTHKTSHGLYLTRFSMPKQSYGKINQQRAQTLFLALLDFANDDLEAEERELERIRSQIQTHWQTEKKLVVRTKTRYLESLIKLTGGIVLSIDQIKTALKHLENHLGILSDHRTAQRGSDN
jgi:hypothetical protein